MERRGGVIHERSRVVELGPRPCLVTAGGEVRAETVILATEGYTPVSPVTVGTSRPSIR